MNEDQNTEVKKDEGGSCCGCGGHGKHAHQDDGAEHQVLKTFDMYHFFSRKDVLFAMAFIVALLAIVVFKTIFAPQPI